MFRTSAFLSLLQAFFSFYHRHHVECTNYVMCMWAWWCIWWCEIVLTVWCEIECDVVLVYKHLYNLSRSAETVIAAIIAGQLATTLCLEASCFGVHELWLNNCHYWCPWKLFALVRMYTSVLWDSLCYGSKEDPSVSSLVRQNDVLLQYNSNIDNLFCQQLLLVSTFLCNNEKASVHSFCSLLFRTGTLKNIMKYSVIKHVPSPNFIYYPTLGKTRWQQRQHYDKFCITPNDILPY